MIEKSVLEDISLIGVPELDNNNHELQDQFHIFIARLGDHRDKKRDQMLHKMLNRMVHLIFRNSRQESTYLKKIGCSCRKPFEESSMSVAGKIMRINQSLNDDMEVMRELAAVLTDWQSQHAKQLTEHLKFHHLYVMLPLRELDCEPDSDLCSGQRRS